jgi:hypothetical protein
MTELDVAEEILQARKDQEDFLSLSFGSISAMGEHGAIIHYEPTEESDKKLEDGLLLLDTGGHYMQGTTDVTRTVVLGEISEYERECYTAVLKGNIALGSAKFPAGTSGNKLDTLARTPLWDMGLDFEHGTGHGVGYILSVHEGQSAVITTNATGNKEFNGKVERVINISSTSANAITGETKNNGYEAEIAVDNAESGLLIGMNAKVKIALESKDDVLAVPYDSIIEEDDKCYVYLAEGTGSKCTAKKVEVEKGMETSYLTEISSSELKDGDRILTDPKNVEDGKSVRVSGSYYEAITTEAEDDGE